MTDPAASCFGIGTEVRFPLHILRSMRAEVDALLSSLRSESKTETAGHAAQIPKPSAKPVRRASTVRETVPNSQERTHEPPGSVAPRDRGNTSQRKKRGGRR